MNATTSPENEFSNSTILIIDDTSANLGMIGECLSSRGFRVMIAQDGEEGIARAELVQPALILLDVMMPGEDGFEVCRRLKSLEGTRDIPVIFMTALSSAEDEAAAFNAGGSDYLTKPLQVEELMACIETHLRLHSLQKRLEERSLQLREYGEHLEQQVGFTRESDLRLREEIAKRERIEAQLRQYERSYQEILDSIVPILGTASRIERLTAITRDVSTRKQYEALQHKREQEFRGLVEFSLDTIACYDLERKRTYANPKLASMIGSASSTEIFGVTPGQVPGGSAAQEYEEMIRNVIAQRRPRDFELRWHTADGEVCSQIRLFPEFDLDGEVVQVWAIGRDTTEIDWYRKKVHQQTFFDGLTELPNRSMLTECMQQEIAANGNRQAFCLMLLDLDNFKEINDALGRDAGDLLLHKVAKRLRDTVGATETVARIGGDEFALLLPRCDGNDCAQSIAARILNALEAPFMLTERELVVTASIGIARYPQDSTEIDDLYKYADAAMYHAKKLGRNNSQFYAQELTSDAAQHLELKTALRHAQKNGELEVVYQPQVDMQTSRLIGVEALLRWNRPGHGVVMPEYFIPLAEACGLIVDIGEWVMTTACLAVVEWNKGRAVPLSVAVNLSARQFIRNDLAASIRDILIETGCQPDWLKLEITESLLLEDSLAATATLEAFRRLGVSVAIDDFGTGYSALNYLSRFPVGQLKIDRSFIRDIPLRRDKAELVKAMLSLAQALHLEVVAEGVETPAQVDYLVTHGCRLAQGYLYGQPMAREGFGVWLREAEKVARR